MERYTGTLKENNGITIRIDRSCEMAAVEVNGSCVMMGNYWDFHNGCFGMYDIPDFNGYRSLVRMIDKYIKSQGKKVEGNIIHEDWEDWKYE